MGWTLDVLEQRIIVKDPEGFHSQRIISNPSFNSAKRNWIFIRQKSYAVPIDPQAADPGLRQSVQVSTPDLPS